MPAIPPTPPELPPELPPEIPPEPIDPEDAPAPVSDPLPPMPQARGLRGQAAGRARRDTWVEARRLDLTEAGKAT